MTEKPRRSSLQSGMSLVELLLAVSIILIVGAIALPGFAAALRASREGRAIANLKAIGGAEMIHYGSNQRFANFDDLIARGMLGNQFIHNFPTSSGGPSPHGPAEIIGDGSYGYKITFSLDSSGIAIDADPKAALAATHRRFRYRIGRAVSGSSGSEGVMYVANPSLGNPPSSAYRPLNQR